ncbi:MULTISPECIES: universal stress protein [unclassified Halomonas]|uniref:universal stress protein n=1 Tax=unclassified Halomonas TaxID=2609666 RepID=UPI0021E425AE|nr:MULTISPECIES: universal stress protein [unclassified Halomonas]UYF99106.1 universal stress protein [Halomonas sp. GD1P12]WNL39739.1 universal stress protein [Halomonas sp. PAMB 3232]
MTEHVFAAIDDSRFAQSVSEYGAWASLALKAPLSLLHVIDNHSGVPGEQDLSGNLSLGSQEQLMETLSSFDERRARENRKRSKALLEQAGTWAKAQGAQANARQLNGTFVETLLELESKTRLLVLGKQGASHSQREELGEHIEALVRRIHRPVLIVPPTFTPPKRVLIAFDGSQTARKGVEMLARSPLFSGAECHVLIVGAATGEHTSELDWALETLTAGEHQAKGAIRAGDVDQTLETYMAEHAIDLMVMGAFGHSRLKHLLMGSTTTKMLRRAATPVLVLR